MKSKFVTLTLGLLMLLTFSACGNEQQETPIDENQQQEMPIDEKEEQETLSEGESQPDTDESVSGKTEPDGDIVDGKLATKENPVPFETWAAVTITDGGWPKPAYVRMVNVITDESSVQVLIDDYNEKNPGRELLELEEHAEFLEYVVVEYEMFFPADFTNSDEIRSRITLSRENNDEGWIASDGSNYFWMGSVETLEAPSSETGYPQNGDTVKCSIIYPMIKGKTDYTLHYQERNEDLSETIDTYFAVE